ncbi:Motility protein FimV [Acidithiobacillus marinus]|uniref:Motility protein FimV n=1 Tax=Acidithiobacillus marinus TaxID=187490 RepID=A0A2I1DKS1_9PROT|nr:FimV/HubP family polar landmark protein [Acidithiobacillus marinus]PKY10492.1 Motility protein FimV [Acidithiobacillus marinus]
MERKNWLWAMAGMGLILPGMAQALGLGSLQVLSAPGEPFRAEIAIQSVTPQAASSLNASLAPASAFAMINLPQAASLEHWQFTVRRGDQPAILISSPVPVSQPHLHFLVQLDWSGGQLVREYTASNTNAVVASPLASPVASMPVTASSEPETAPASRASVPDRLYHGWSRVSRYGPVPLNSSLYDISRSITDSHAVTLDQVMSAVVKANPQAFKNANPTYLYAGSMLNLPSLTQVQAMAPAQATAWLASQSRGGSVNPAAVDKAVQASTPVANKKLQPVKTTTSPTESATHLVLSSAPASAASVSASTSSSNPAALAANTLALQTENQKLKTEVSGLGQRLSAEERLLANQGMQLATLSRNSANNSLLSNIPLLISLGGNLLLLILFIWMLRRQKESERRQREVSQRLSALNNAKPKSAAEPQAAPVPASVTPAPTVAPAPVVAPVAAPVAAFHADPEPAAVSAPPVSSAVTPVITTAPEDLERAAVAADQAPVTSPGSDHDDVMEIDPIEQADLYLTYGKSEQAITVMNEALDENPRRKELYVKLLDMYATLDRHTDYLDLAERMRGRFGPHNAAWQEVAAQGARLFPGNALFVSEPEAEVTETARPSAVKDSVDAVRETPVAAEADAGDKLDFQFSHDEEKAEPVSGNDAFPSEEKDRLMHDINEQFRLIDEEQGHAEPASIDTVATTHVSGAAQETENAHAEDTLPFSFGLTPFEEESAPASTPSVEHNVEAKAEPELEPEVFHETPKPFVADASSSAGSDDWDAVGTKLDLAKAYVEMGDSESARDLLEEVSKEGSSTQREEAQKMLEDL